MLGEWGTDAAPVMGQTTAFGGCTPPYLCSGCVWTAIAEYWHGWMEHRNAGSFLGAAHQNRQRVKLRWQHKCSLGCLGWGFGTWRCSVFIHQGWMPALPAALGCAMPSLAPAKGHFSPSSSTVSQLPCWDSIKSSLYGFLPVWSWNKQLCWIPPAIFNILHMKYSPNILACAHCPWNYVPPLLCSSGVLMIEQIYFFNIAALLPAA